MCVFKRKQNEVCLGVICVLHRITAEVIHEPSSVVYKTGSWRMGKFPFGKVPLFRESPEFT